MATILTIIVTYGVSFIPLKFEFSKAIRQEFLGFDIYDLYYSGKHLKNSQRDTNIVLIEIGPDRQAIAGQITRIQNYSPAVIGVDAVFEKKGVDPLADTRLIETISQYNNIVFASRIDIDKTTKKPVLVRNFFDNEGHYYPSGYINFLGNQFSVIRNYPPFYKAGNSVQAFSSAILEKFSPGKFDTLSGRKKKLEVINYKGNLERYNSISKEQLEYYDTTGQLKEMLTHKIVLLGYFIKQPPLVMEDLHFSPLNEQISGKSFPDMYGVVIHANILSMILSNDHVSQASDFVSYLYASLIIFLFLLYMLSQYKKRMHPHHGKFLLIQFLLIIVVLYVFLQVFNLFGVKVPLLPIMIALVLCVELLGAYKQLALWLHKKYHYRTVFNHKHII